MASCGFGFDIRLLMMGITSSVFLLNVLVVVIVVVLRYESPNEKKCVLTSQMYSKPLNVLENALPTPDDAICLLLCQLCIIIVSFTSLDSLSLLETHNIKTYM